MELTQILKTSLLLKSPYELNNLQNNYSIENIALSSNNGEIGFEFSKESNLHKINADISPESPAYRKIKTYSFDTYFSDKTISIIYKNGCRRS